MKINKGDGYLAKNLREGSILCVRNNTNSLEITVEKIGGTKRKKRVDLNVKEGTKNYNSHIHSSDRWTLVADTFGVRLSSSVSSRRTADLRFMLPQGYSIERYQVNPTSDSRS